MNPSQRRDRMASWVITGGFILILGLVVVLMGAVVALFPSSFVVKLAILLGGGLTLLVALAMPKHRAAPVHLIRRLLNILLFASVVWPAFVSWKVPGLPGANPTRLLQVTLLLLWLFWLAASTDLASRLYSRLKALKPISIALTALVFWRLLSDVTSAEPLSSLWLFILEGVTIYLFFLVALSCYRTVSDLEHAFAWLAVAALIVCAIGLVESARLSNPFLGILPADPEQLEALQWIIADKSRSGAYRIHSTFSHPLALAEFLCMALPLASHLALRAGTRVLRWIGWLAIPALLVNIYLSHTRAAMIVAFVQIAVIMLIVSLRAIRRSRSFRKAVLGMFVIFVVGVASIGVLGVATDLVVGRDVAERGSTQARVMMIEQGLPLIAQQPLVGFGGGTAAYKLGFFAGNTLTIDNYFLSLTLDSGVPALAFFLFAAMYGAFCALRVGFTGPERFQLVGVVLGVVLISFLIFKSIHSLTNNFTLFYVLLAATATVIEKGGCGWRGRRRKGRLPSIGNHAGHEDPASDVRADRQHYVCHSAS